MVVPRPLDVEALMRTPRKGRLITVGEIRARLARAARVEAACPLTTGIFMRIAADAAEEDAAAGLKPVTPYWRTIRDDGSLIEKFPGGVENQIRRLEAEGHTVERPKRGKPRLVGFEKKLTAESPKANATKSLRT
ncbi:MAG: MGMT family protein [Planctomycetes bacterium]|nr:MGMT family protein [Planctomycetota bacterium]